jgi:alpha-tubulin suppressor-like RCC1 family protein
MALTDSRQLWVWGDNSEGQLGIPVPSPCLDPVQTHAFPAEATIMYIVAGGEHSLAAVQNAGDLEGDEAQQMWSECRGHTMAAMPGPSLAAGLAEQNDYPRKVCLDGV